MKGKRVLVVDDERNIRLTVRRALEAPGITCEEALNGEDALEKVRGCGHDLILLDLMMPGINGVELLRRLRESGCWAKVLIITAYGTVESAVEVMKLGAIDFIQKPFSPDQLRHIVSQALRRDAGFLRGLRLTPGQYRKRFSRAMPDEELRRIKAETGADGLADYDFCLQQAKGAVEGMDFDSAEAWAQKAVAVEPKRPEAFNFLGVFRELRAERLEAQKYYRAALALDPTYEPAQNNLHRSTQVHQAGTLDLGGTATTRRGGRAARLRLLKGKGPRKESA